MVAFLGATLISLVGVGTFVIYQAAQMKIVSEDFNQQYKQNI